MESKSEIEHFLQKNKDLFWHFDKSKLNQLSLDVIIEYILNYGDEEATKELIDIVGIEKVANIFFKNTASGRRVNYFPEVKNFFTIYFNRHAPRNI